MSDSTPSPADAGYEVLARRYRPQTFAEMVGQEHVAEALRNAIRTDRVAHAFLFTGIRGVGKTTAARILAKALNCENPRDGEPCNECGSCTSITRSRSLDVVEIDGASNRGIDSIRELNEAVQYRATGGRFRIYIIDEAHMVTREGFNALLKTLEEPPSHVKFIFATTAIDKFPDTIVSRCQRYDFRRVPLDSVQASLRSIAEQEKITIDDAAIFQVAREAQGSMRDAQSLFDRLIAFVGAGTPIGDAQVADVLAITDRKTLHEIADAILSKDPKAALALVDRVYESGRDLERFSHDLVEHARNLVVAAIYEGEIDTALRELPETERAELRAQAKRGSVSDFQRIFRIAQEGERDIRGASMPRFVLEMALVRMATLEPAVPVDEVLERLDAIAGGGSRGGAPARPSKPSRSAPAREGRGQKAQQPAEATSPAAPPATVPTAARAQPAPGNGGTRWEEFLSFVQSKRLSLFLTLHHGRPVEERGEALVIGVTRDRFRKELESPGTLGELQSLAAEFFGGPRKLSVILTEEDTAEGPAAPEPSPAETLENPAVRRAVEILGGEVREVRKRGKESL